MNLLDTCIRWLRSAPVDDPVDRRNASVMQVLFAITGIGTPLLWGDYLVQYFDIAMTRVVSLWDGLAITLACWIGFGMIRRGRLRGAVVLYLSTVLLASFASHLAYGLHALMAAQLDQLMVLIVAALVLGQRALWSCFAALCAIVVAGAAVDAAAAVRAGNGVDQALRNLPSLLLTYLLIGVVLDRTVAALRASLSEAERRGQALQREIEVRERMRTQLVHSQKLEAVGRLASGIAHDFGNMLGVVSGYAQQRDRILSMPSRVEQEAAIDKVLTGIEAAADRATAITRKLLSFSRHEMSRPQAFDALEAIQAMHAMLRQTFPSHVHLELEPATQPAPVWFDRGEFELMVLNIAVNARDAMLAGGAFRIAVETPSPNATRISLSDDGHGMDSRVRERVFEPFFSTKADTGGTGLGLSVIRDMILAGGGGIEVDSSPGVGSTFHVTLPSGPSHDAEACLGSSWESSSR